MTGPISLVTISSLEEPIHKNCAIVTYIPPAAPSKLCLSYLIHLIYAKDLELFLGASSIIVISDKRKLAKKMDKKLIFLPE